MEEKLKEIKRTICRQLFILAGMTDAEIQQHEIDEEQKEVARSQQKLERRNAKLRKVQARMIASQKLHVEVRKAVARTFDSPIHHRIRVPTLLSTSIPDTTQDPRGEDEDITEGPGRAPPSHRARPPPISYNTRNMGYKIQAALGRSRRATGFYGSDVPTSDKDEAGLAIGLRQRSTTGNKSRMKTSR